MSKYTPGPWRVGEQTEKQHTRIEQCSARGDGQWSITVGWVNDDANTVPDADGRLGETWKANARLIAAAPDLLEALDHCEKILNAWFADPGDDPGRRAMAAVNKARAAIAKAEGDQ